METLRPGSLEELRGCVADALAERTPLAIEGAGSKAEIGRPRGTETTLSLAELRGIDLYEPEELVMSAGAGEPLASIEAALAEKGQMLAFEPVDLGALSGGGGSATIGGVFATNASGPRRLTAGAARDALLGLTAVSGRAEILRAGGRVMKNVTGYDLPKLFAGSWGSLGAVSRVTFKTAPKPADERTLAFSGEAEPRLFALLRAATGSAASPSAAALTRLGALLRFEGEKPSIEARIEGLLAGPLADAPAPRTLDREESAAIWAELRSGAFVPASARVVWRISAPPSEAETIGARLDAIGAGRVHDWAGGLVWAWLTDEEPRATEVRAAIEDGHATSIRAPEGARAVMSAFQPRAPALAALEARIVRAFDPEGLFGGGRIAAPGGD